MKTAILNPAYITGGFMDYYDLKNMTTDELLSLLSVWKGAGNYRLTGDIVAELRERRKNDKKKLLKRATKSN